MYSLHRIYRGRLPNKGHEAFLFMAERGKRLVAAFASGPSLLSLCLGRDTRVLLNHFPACKDRLTDPNKRPVMIDMPLETGVVSGVISHEQGEIPNDDVSVYLVLKEE